MQLLIRSPIVWTDILSVSSISQKLSIWSKGFLIFYDEDLFIPLIALLFLKSSTSFLSVCISSVKSHTLALSCASSWVFYSMYSCLFLTLKLKLFFYYWQYGEVISRIYNSVFTTDSKALISLSSLSRDFKFASLIACYSIWPIIYTVLFLSISLLANSSLICFSCYLHSLEQLVCFILYSSNSC